MSTTKPEWREFATENFNAKEYVERLTSTLISDARRDTTTFNPSPFLKLFETSIDNLVKVRKGVQRKVGELEDVVQAAESSHRNRIKEMEPVFDETTDTFEKLETLMEDVGSSAILIGEQLESLDKQRSRAQDAKNLLLYFMEFNDGITARLDAVKNSQGWEGKNKAAQTIKRLTVIAKEVDLPAAEKARTAIEKYGESIERELLDDFEQAFKDDNVTVLKTCAKILLDFNGGNSCVQAFVNHHQFFIKNTGLVSNSDEQIENTPFQLIDDLLEYEKNPAALHMSLGLLFDNIIATVQKEWKTIDAVFYNPISVLLLFVQRIFAQTVQSQLEQLLSSASHKSLLCYLQTLKTAHAATSECVASINSFVEKQLDLEQSAVVSLKVSLHRCLEDIFSNYTDNDKFIEKEMQNVVHVHNLAINHMVQFRAGRKNVLKNKGYFSKLQSVAIIGAQSVQAVESFQALPAEMGLSIMAIARVLMIQKQSIDRTFQLSSSTDCARYTHMIFSNFLDGVGHRFIEVCLDLVFEDLASLEPKSEPDLKYFGVIQVINGVVHCIQEFFLKCIQPLISVQPNIHRETMIRKNDFVGALEGKINTILQKIIGSAIAWLNMTLSKQKKNDFRPKDNEISEKASSATAPCIQCCEYLNKLHLAIVGTLDGRNLEVVLVEIGVQFHGILLEHVKKFVINTNGGMLLTKDLAKYQENVMTWKLPPVSDRFEALRQLGNIYLVRPENLKTLLEEGSLSRVDPAILHAFVANRSDYKAAKLDALFHGVVLEHSEKERSAWENLESVFDGAFDVVNDTIGEVGDSLKKMLVV